MKLKSGAVLIELLLYLSITTAVILMAFKLLHEAYAFTVVHMSDNSAQLNLCIAQDLFARDIATVSSDISSWKILQPEFIVATNGATDIGWQCISNSLVRFVGLYDASTNHWHKVTKSILIREGIAGSFNVYKKRIDGQEIIIGLELLVTYAKKEYGYYQALRDRVSV